MKLILRLRIPSVSSEKDAYLRAAADDPCLPGCFSFIPLNLTPRQSVTKWCVPSKGTISLRASPHHSISQTNSWQCQGRLQTQLWNWMLQSTCQGPEKFAEIPVSGRRNPSNPHCALAVPSRLVLCSSRLGPMREQPRIIFGSSMPLKLEEAVPIIDQRVHLI